MIFELVSPFPFLPLSIVSFTWAATAFSLFLTGRLSLKPEQLIKSPCAFSVWRARFKSWRDAVLVTLLGSSMGAALELTHRCLLRVYVREREQGATGVRARCCVCMN